jgi:hypothetical protein
LQARLRHDPVPLHLVRPPGAGDGYVAAKLPYRPQQHRSIRISPVHRILSRFPSCMIHVSFCVPRFTSYGTEGTRMRQLFRLVLVATLASGKCYAAASEGPAAITVQVLNPDGKPAGGASVVQTLFGRGGVVDTSDHPNQIWSPVTCTADADGRVTLAPQAIGYEAAIYHSAGYALCSSSQPPENGLVRLVPWAKLRGQALVDGKPAAQREVEVDVMAPDDPSPSTETEASVLWFTRMQTDRDGRFLVRRLPTGTARVALLGEQWQVIPVGGPFREGPTTTLVDVASGHTVDATIGAPGRSVEGVIKVPAALVAIRQEWDFYIGDVRTKRVYPAALQLPMPESIRHGSPEQMRQWIKTFEATPAGKALWLEQSHWLQKQRIWETSFEVKPDDTFVVPGVPPGTYEIQIAAVRTTDLLAPDGAGSGTGPLAVARGTFVVPPIRGNVSEVPLKLPPLELVPVAGKRGD